MINANFSKLEKNYLFSEIANRVFEFSSANPNTKVLKMGIGDVTRPLPFEIINAMNQAVLEFSNVQTFKGYPPEGGCLFLRESIAKYYKNRNISINAEDIFVSDGAKSDCANILDIFGSNISAIIQDPAYPVYIDTNLMLGNNVKLIPTSIDNGFLMKPPDAFLKFDLVYICSPNNPTGCVYNKDTLKAWVDYANSCGSVIIFDSAYEAFVSDGNLPRSIFEIEGARTCAIEIGSFSKTAGFTGLRCAYTIMCDELARDNTRIKDLWARRHATKTNGVSYVTQCGANAVFQDGDLNPSIRQNIDYYKKNAEILSNTLKNFGQLCCGGENSPYIWFKTPNNMDSWELFDILLKETNIVCTPGAGFGKSGQNYVRFSAFGSYEDTLEASYRLQNFLK